MSNIAVGNEYTRQLGANKQYVTIVGINDNGTVSVVSKSGRQKFCTKIENVDRWELIKGVETARETPQRVTAKTVDIGTVEVRAKKRLNSRPLVDILIDTINANNVPMSSKQLVEKLKTDGSYVFSPTAKTPWNSVSSRLHTYLNENANNATFKIVGRGLFVKKDYTE